MQFLLTHIVLPIFLTAERFNETIVDAIPTYLLNICEVCGSSQCPYCSIYNAAGQSAASLMLVLSAVCVLVLRQVRGDGAGDALRIDRGR